LTSMYHCIMRTRHPAGPDGGLDPVLDFMRLLWGIEHHLQSVSKRMEASLGITGPQRLVLRVVSRFPGLSAGELARVVHLHPSTMTGILQRLVRKGLLSRDRDPEDSRRVRLHVRPEARAFTRRSHGTVEAAIASVLTRVSAQQVRHSRLVLIAVAAALEEDGR
jgi:MarR family transcriptional regulator, organic hydroperoxide resistance regulator